MPDPVENPSSLDTSGWVDPSCFDNVPTDTIEIGSSDAPPIPQDPHIALVQSVDAHMTTSGYNFTVDVPATAAGSLLVLFVNALGSTSPPSNGVVTDNGGNTSWGAFVQGDFAQNGASYICVCQSTGSITQLTLHFEQGQSGDSPTLEALGRFYEFSISLPLHGEFYAFATVEDSGASSVNPIVSDTADTITGYFSIALASIALQDHKNLTFSNQTASFTNDTPTNGSNANGAHDMELATAYRIFQGHGAFGASYGADISQGAYWVAGITVFSGPLPTAGTPISAGSTGAFCSNEGTFNAPTQENPTSLNTADFVP